MTAFIEAIPWCLWAIVILKMLPRFDRLIGLAERGLSLWEKGALEDLLYQRRKLTRK